MTVDELTPGLRVRTRRDEHPGHLGEPDVRWGYIRQLRACTEPGHHHLVAGVEWDGDLRIHWWHANRLEAPA